MSPRTWPILARTGRALRLALAAAAVVPFLAALPLHPADRGIARAAQAWPVQVGGVDETGAINAQGYFPSSVLINAGDSVLWQWAPAPVPHTVTFLGGQPPLTDIVPGPEFGEAALGPANFPAGPGGPDATYPVSEVVSSGPQQVGSDEPFSFQLTFTEPGVYEYVCLFHPGMRGEVQVLPAGAPLPESPEQAQARGRSTFTARLGTLQAMLPSVRPASADDLHTVDAGLASGFGVSALQFLPGDLTVRRGERVAWTIADPFEIHTITFTSGQEAPPFIEVRPQAEGSPLLVIPAEVASPRGGSSYDGAEYANSGILTPGNSYILTIDAPPGVYDYLCVVHPQMRGRVVVVE